MADTLRGFEASMHNLFSPKKRSRGGGRKPRGAVNACHRFLEVVGGSMSAEDLASHITGLGFWATTSEKPGNTLTSPLNTDFHKAGELETSRGKPYNPENGSVIERVSAGQFGLRTGAPPALIPVDVDVPMEGYLAAIKVGLFNNHFDLKPAMTEKKAMEILTKMSEKIDAKIV